MPELTIPLVGAFTRRLGGASTVDQQFINGVYTEATNPAAKSREVYFEKRNGLSLAQTPAAGAVGAGMFFSPSTSSQISIFTADAGATFDIYDLVTKIGSSSTKILHISEAILNGLTFTLFTSYSEAFFYDLFAMSSFTGDTHTSTTIDNISHVGTLYVGQLLSGHADIAAGTRIASIVSGNSITVTLATLGTHSGITITSSKVAKIMDPDFPTDLTGPMCEMDGYLFMGTQSGKIYNSDLNTPISWGAANFIQANVYTDPGIGAFKYKDRIGFFGTNSLEFFHNAGNPTGSPLSRDASSAIKIGCSGGGSGQIAASFDVNQDYIAWTDPSGSFYIYKDGLKKLSNPGLVLTGSADRTVTVFKYKSLDVISVYAGSGTPITFWYFPEYDLWTNIGTSLSQIYISSNNYAAASAVTYLTIGAGTAGKTYTLGSNTTFQDNGAAFTMTIQTEPKVLNKGKGFIINSIELLADTQSSGSTTIQVSRDDYATFTTLDQAFDLTQTRKRVERCGYYKNHVIFKLTDSGNNAWRGQALVVDYTPCNT